MKKMAAQVEVGWEGLVLLQRRTYHKKLVKFSNKNGSFGPTTVTATVCPSFLLEQLERGQVA